MSIGEVLDHFWPVHPMCLVLGGGLVGLAAWVLLVAVLLCGIVCVFRRAAATAFFCAAYLQSLIFVFVAGILPAYAAYAFLPSSPEDARRFVIEVFSRALLAVLLAKAMLGSMALAVWIRCERKPSVPCWAWVSMLVIHLDFAATWVWRLPIGNNMLWR
ncbi:MAG: hypothetical protein PHR35_16020 [Kiritimatiellae bacterium]|nr:hypothetical protein [Kiritimatiellia bacterium]